MGLIGLSEKPRLLGVDFYFGLYTNVSSLDNSFGGGVIYVLKNIK